MIATISLFIFWTAFFGALTTKKYWSHEEDELETRMRRLIRKEASLSDVGNVLMSAKESRRLKKLRRELLMSGLHRKSDLDKAMRIESVCRFFPLVFCGTFFFMGVPLPQILILGLLFSLIFILVPRFFRIRMIMRRRREIERHLPTALDLLVLCLEAGMSFDAALVRVAEEQRRVSTQISREFLFTNQEILAGVAREEALRNLAWRTGVEDLRNIVAAVLQSIKLGTSLVKTLRTQSEVLRKKRRERIRALILKTPVKLIFPLLFFIFPTLLIVILAPSLINIFRHLSGIGF